MIPKSITLNYTAVKVWQFFKKKKFVTISDNILTTYPPFRGGMLSHTPQGGCDQMSDYATATFTEV